MHSLSAGVSGLLKVPRIPPAHPWTNSKLKQNFFLSFPREDRNVYIFKLYMWNFLFMVFMFKRHGSGSDR